MNKSRDRRTTESLLIESPYVEYGRGYGRYKWYGRTDGSAYLIGQRYADERREPRCLRCPSARLAGLGAYCF